MNVLKNKIARGLVMIGLLGAMSSVLAAPGSLDTSFGAGGVLVSPTSAPSNRVFANATAVVPNGKLVTAGRSMFPNNFAVFTRHNSNGTLDATFGGTGELFVTPSITVSNARVEAVVVQPDGKVIGAGYGRNALNTKSFVWILRLNVNGSLDSSFGVNGHQLFYPIDDASSVHVSAVGLQADGKIVVAGSSSPVSVSDGLLVRLNSNGSLDTSFDGDGIAWKNLGDDESFYNLALQADGKIIAVGGGYNSDGNYGGLVARFNADGSVDNSFGSNGVVITLTSLGQDSEFYGVTIQPDGKIVAGGWFDGPDDRDTFVVRFNSNGSLDTSFGVLGRFEADLNGSGGDDQISRALALQPDSKIVAAADFNGPMAALRLNANGSRDVSFGANGVATTNIGNNNGSHAYALAVQPDGKIVAAGYYNDPLVGGNRRFALVRYLANDANNDGIAEPWGVTPANFGLGEERAFNRSVQTTSGIRIAGLDDNVFVPATITNAEFSINGASYQSFGYVRNGDTVNVRYDSKDLNDVAFAVGGVHASNNLAFLAGGLYQSLTGALVAADDELAENQKGSGSASWLFLMMLGLPLLLRRRAA
ncbi:MAG: hypothetical protein H0W44_02560 [Gammaproteobacteria bacterium]|nr:hypothetical protein [Gammaproteobacteria bacterium]